MIARTPVACSPPRFVGDCRPLPHLAGIGLTELIARAELQTRYDRKYVLPVDEAEAVLAALDPDTRVLEIDLVRTFGYRSIYFDTPDLTSYHACAGRRRRRFKVRTRTYLDSGECWLEVKTCGPRGSTVKSRQRYPADQAEDLTTGRDYVDGVLRAASVALPAGRSLHPVLVTDYRRTTLYLPATASRVTIDRALRWRDNRAGQLWLPGRVVLETKTGSVPSAVDRLLWRRGYRPVRLSKYGTGLAALRPELPAGPWRYTLRRHLPYLRSRRTG